MTLQFRHVALFGKHPSTQASAAGLEESRAVLTAVAQFLRAEGCTVVIESGTATHLSLLEWPSLSIEEIGQRCDLGLVIGGDGTMLGVGRQVATHDLPLIGINQGRLGFMTDLPLDQYALTLPAMLRGQYEEDPRRLLHARVVRQDQTVFDAVALNDVVVNRGGSSGTVGLRVEVDGRFVSSQRSDGLILATTTGSTAYSLSVGGPLMHPSIRGWVLAPIAPHSLSNRPIVLSDSSEVVIELTAGREASANVDMQSITSLQLGDRIVVRCAAHSVRFLHPLGWNYFDTLRKKLHWNEGGA